MPYPGEVNGNNNLGGNINPTIQKSTDQPMERADRQGAGLAKVLTIQMRIIGY